MPHRRATAVVPRRRRRRTAARRLHRRPSLASRLTTRALAHAPSSSPPHTNSCARPRLPTHTAWRVAMPIVRTPSSSLRLALGAPFLTKTHTDTHTRGSCELTGSFSIFYDFAPGTHVSRVARGSAPVPRRYSFYVAPRDAEAPRLRPRGAGRGHARDTPAPHMTHRIPLSLRDTRHTRKLSR